MGRGAGQERVGRHDNFFALGGDSILSIQIVARAQQAGLQVSPKQLFQYQSIAELAAVVGVGPGMEEAQLRGLIEVFMTNGRIRYLPPQDPLKTRIALLRASELPELSIAEQQQGTTMREPAWGWSLFAAGPVAVHWVPGDHITIMTKPHVEVLADRLRDSSAHQK